MFKMRKTWGKRKIMGAFNEIKFQHVCPHCENIVEILAQTHLASDFNGEGAVNFFRNTYELGEKMKWYGAESKEYSQWRNNAHEFIEAGVIECCYAECMQCKSDLYAVVSFEELRPIEILGVGFERDWPANYSM
jgi:hypothetical protein